MKLKFTLLFIFIIVLNLQCKSIHSNETRLNDDNIIISLLTIDKGKSLADSFGHSGIRIINNEEKYDIVFNYGIYNFDDPNFYVNFMKGYLKYSLGVSNFKDFYESYRNRNRSIKEQILDLPKLTKKRIVKKLIIESRPENKFYFYDYFENNCSTKIKDVLENNISNLRFDTPKYINKESYRSLIYKEIKPNSWGALAIDLCLGAKIDIEIAEGAQTFLPNYLSNYLNNSYTEINDLKLKLVNNEKFIFKSQNSYDNHKFISPLLLLSIISVLLLYTIFYEFKNSKYLKIVNSLILIITSCIGLILFFLWFFTDHQFSSYNYNLLWASPLNFILLLNNLKPKWKIAYLKFLILSLCLLLIHWLSGVQVFNISLIPLLISLFFKYLYLIRYYKIKIIN